MHNILIVDDSKTNRMLLDALVKEYMQEHNLEGYQILEAVNGVEAVEMSKQNKMDIIFMDIMMPEMDGIEATAKIKEHDKKAMIIAVSALDDEENKRKILKNGAEDYMVKPVSTEVLKKRLNQYITIISARSEKRKNNTPVNIMDNSIFSRRLVFLIQDEPTLVEFWEYYLLNSQTNSESMIELVRILYGLGAWQIKLKFHFEITVEESDDNTYFTMNNMKLLKTDTVEKLIQKNFPNGIYHIKEDKLTFCITKNDLQESAKQPQAQPAIQAQQTEAAPVQQTTQPEAAAPIVHQEETLEIYDFMDGEDMEELHSILNELNSLMLLVGSSNLEQQEVLMISGYIEKFSKILSQYGETYDLYNALNTLAIDIRDNVVGFQENSKNIATLCAGFTRDLEIWQAKLFVEGAPSVDFLDNSIISNSNMISSFIKPQQQEEESIDDIFDF